MQVGSRRTAKFSFYYSLIVLFAVVYLIRPTTALSQMENANWIFGYGAGINFNTSPPSVISGVQLFTDEGCASVSDKNGNLLFYTDGRTVWNFNHSIMANGTGLMAHISSTQAALITSKPGNCDQYYIFTTDGAENNFSNGLRYSVVDMSALNGLGQVVQKNILLHTPVVEKLIAIPAIDSSYIWLLAHEWNSNAFLLFKITQTNITLERKQNIGAVHSGGIGNINGVGYAKVNASGTKIALTNRSINSVELFDFDRSTGLLSNPIDLNPVFERGYGIEFSPDNSKLYIGTNFHLYQYDLTVHTKNAILASEFLITSTFRTLRALQRAPDNKIYIAISNSSFIGVINSPNLSGVNSNYTELGFNISPGTSIFGLPTPALLVPGSPSLFLGNDSTLCNEQSLTINLTRPGTTYLWNDGSINSVFTISQTGQYIAEIQNSCGTARDTINILYKQDPVINLPSDTLLCLGAKLFLDVTTEESNYSWQDGSTNSTYLVELPGKYKVDVTNYCNTVSDSLIVNYLSPPPQFSLGADTTLCPFNELKLSVNIPNSTFIWQDGSTDSNFNVTSPGEYSLTVLNLCGEFTDSIQVNFIQLDSLYFPNIITPNNDDWNEFFEIDSRLLGAKIEIFNRWGKTVYYSSNYNNDWNGGNLASGVYYYTLVDQCLNQHKGWIHLIR